MTLISFAYYCQSVLASCSLPHILSNGAIPIPICPSVHELWCVEVWALFTYYGRLSHVSLDTVIRSDTDFDVLFALALTVKKIADRCTFLSAYWAACPMVVSLIGYGRILWQH